jgi:hypothetical protein
MKPSNNIYTDGEKFFRKYNITNNIIKKISIEGSFAYCKKYKNYFVVARDHLGCKKIFWGITKKGKIIFSDNFIDLYNKTKNAESIKSCPAGFIIFINKNATIIKKINIKRLNNENYSFINLKSYSNKIKKKIFLYLQGIRKLYGNKVYVCLSGGLDSTIIAYLAKKVFKEVIAISCSMLSDKQYKMLLDKKHLSKNLNVSDDLKNARKISKELGIKFKSIYFPESNCIKDLKKTMYACQDWRDFNVHCAILNFQIAKILISDKNYNNEPVLTGDLMNEYLADYKSEKINGIEYYPQMKQPVSVKQRYLIKGLESSDRENGIFNFFKIPIFQPYSFVDMYYKHLPKKYLNKKKIKELLNGNIVNKKILNLISKKKMRAQIGGGSRGILGFMIKKKIFQKTLEKKFCQNFKISKKFISSFIDVGSYKN